MRGGDFHSAPRQRTPLTELCNLSHALTAERDGTVTDRERKTNRICVKRGCRVTQGQIDAQIASDVDGRTDEIDGARASPITAGDNCLSDAHSLQKHLKDSLMRISLGQR